MDLKFPIEKLNSLININENNKLKNYIVSNYLNYNSQYINKKMIDLFKKNIGMNMTNEEAYKILLLSLFEDQVTKTDYLMIKNYIFNSVKKISPKEYYSNPYYMNIKVNNIKNNNWELTKINYKPYEGFIYNYTIEDELFNTFPSLGFFEKEFSYLAVLENNREWMAVKPNEIETMKIPISNASGNILTFGLGLGYFAYMCSLKENVSSITIVEKDEKVIEMFRKNILPHFEYKSKINIINADAFDYYEKLQDEEYDYIFIDIWHDVSDGIYSYLKFKKTEKRFLSTKIDYWIEKEILLFLRTIIINLLKEVNDGIDPLSIKSQNEKLDNLYASIYNFLMKENYQNIDELLEINNLRNISRYIL